MAPCSDRGSPREFRARVRGTGQARLRTAWRTWTTPLSNRPWSSSWRRPRLEHTSTLEQRAPPRYTHFQAHLHRHSQAELRFHHLRHSSSSLYPWHTTLLLPSHQSQSLTERRRRLPLMMLLEEARQVQLALDKLSTPQYHTDSNQVCWAHLNNHISPDPLKRSKDRHHTAAFLAHRNSGRHQTMRSEHTPDHSHHRLLLRDRLAHRLSNTHLDLVHLQSVKACNPLRHHRTRHPSTVNRPMASRRNNSHRLDPNLLAF